MELRKRVGPAWAASGLLMAVSLLNVAADSTTQPAAKPMTTTATPAAPVQNRNDNNGNNNNYNNYNNRNRGDRNNRGNRNRGDRGGSSSTPSSSADAFTVLNARSIFVKGNQQISANSGQQSSQPTGALAHKPESSLVFNGVTVIDGQANAFIEDLTADHVSTVKVGDGIAGGKVSAITFDTLSYAANGKVLNVTLGQNLEGNTGISTSTDSTPGATAGPTTLPFAPGYIGVGSSSGVITNGMSPEDILARMKAKRQAELGK